MHGPGRSAPWQSQTVSRAICSRSERLIDPPFPSVQQLSSPSTFFRVQGLSTPIQILSVARISAGVAAFIAPAFLTNKVYGFSTRQSHGAGVTANTTTAKPGAPEETLQAARLVASRDIVLGLALRDSTRWVSIDTLAAANLCCPARERGRSHAVASLQRGETCARLRMDSARQEHH